MFSDYLLTSIFTVSIIIVGRCLILLTYNMSFFQELEGILDDSIFRRRYLVHARRVLFNLLVYIIILQL